MQDEYEDDGIEQLVEQIQIGDASEGAHAVREIAKRFGPDPQAIERVMRQSQARDRVVGEFNDALGDFNKKNPNIANDTLLAEAGMTAVRSEIAKDLKSLGVPDEELDRIKGDNNVMLGAYTTLRANGRQVRAPKELFGAVADNFRERGIRTGGARSPLEVIREMRTARGFSNDEGTIGPDRRAGPTAQEEAQREKTRRYIQQTRKARGQSYYETYE
jgi:hypothetical protein